MEKNFCKFIAWLVTLVSCRTSNGWIVLGQFFPDE